MPKKVFTQQPVNDLNGNQETVSGGLGTQVSSPPMTSPGQVVPGESYPSMSGVMTRNSFGKSCSKLSIGQKSWNIIQYCDDDTARTKGLSEAKELALHNGMMFDMGTPRGQVVINMQLMNFPLDIIFINSSKRVLTVANQVTPGNDVAYTGSDCKYFLEVNGGEAKGIKVGDAVEWEKDEQLDDIQKAKVYLAPGQAAPKGEYVHLGKKGGHFYIPKMNYWKRDYKENFTDSFPEKYIVHPTGFGSLDEITNTPREKLVQKIYGDGTQYSNMHHDEMIEAIKKSLNFIDFYIKLSTDEKSVSDQELNSVAKDVTERIGKTDYRVVTQFTEGHAVENKIEEYLTKNKPILLFGDREDKIIAIDDFVALSHATEPTIIPHTFGLIGRTVEPRIRLQNLLSDILDFLAKNEDKIIAKQEGGMGGVGTVASGGFTPTFGSDSDAYSEKNKVFVQQTKNGKWGVYKYE